MIIPSPKSLSAAVFLSTAILVSTPVQAGPTDGTVVGITKVVDNGPATDRFNLVILGDGYTAAQQQKYANDTQDFIDYLFNTPPFKNNCSAINIYRIDVESSESGADDPDEQAGDPPSCVGGTGNTAATYFDATFCSDGAIRRLLGVNNATATSVLNSMIPEWDQALVLVNSIIYGGSGGSVGVTSLSGDWQDIAVHEFGHSAFGLADEYEYYRGCSSGETDRDNHPPGEPVEPNVTLETDPNLIKWKAFIDPLTDIPTTTNADCSVCDPQPNPFPGDTVVGLYEGGHYYHCDGYRPVFNCMMRNYAPFCPVCTQRILSTLDPFQPPNTAPSCDAGGPYTAECTGASTSVQLNGSGSTDVDCDVLTFLWTGGFSGGSADGKSPSVQFVGLGSFPVSLDVSDPDATSSCGANVTVQDTTDPSITAPGDITGVECTSPQGAVVALGDPVVSDICDPSVSVQNDAPAVFPIGDTTVTWTASDDSGNSSSDTQQVEVVDTTPPTLSVSVSPTILWPPNHSMVSITATITVEDTCDAAPSVKLVSIISSEPDDDTGDGSTLSDIQEASFGTDDRNFLLRSERKGNGPGRVYTITYEASDANGNVASQEVVVTVPNNQS